LRRPGGERPEPCRLLIRRPAQQATGLRFCQIQGPEGLELLHHLATAAALLQHLEQERKADCAEYDGAEDQ
jgi:hypothetical protein